MKKVVFLCILCLISGHAVINAQSQTAQPQAPQSAAEEIEILLQTGAVTYAQAARFVLEAADVLAVSDPEAAFRYASERKWLPKKAAGNDEARLDGISLLCMRSFGMKGGMWYSMTKGSHYAYRELAYRDVIQGRADPGMKVSGERLLFMTGRILSQQGDVAALAAGAELQTHPAEAVSAPEADNDVSAASEALAAQINAILEDHHVADTSAKATHEGIVIRLSNIQFLADSARLPPSEIQKIQEIAGILKAIPGRKIQIAGHTAAAGSRQGQRSISRERAQAVASQLVSLKAIAASDIVVIGYGAERPIANNATDAGRAANRRVEITILEN